MKAEIRASESKILRDDIGVGHRDTEIVFDEGHQLENAGRIDDVVLDERCVVGEFICGIAEEKVLDDECPDLVLDRLSHSTNPFFQCFYAASALRRLLPVNVCSQSCVERTPTKAALSRNPEAGRDWHFS